MFYECAKMRTNIRQNVDKGTVQNCSAKVQKKKVNKNKACFKNEKAYSCRQKVF